MVTNENEFSKPRYSESSYRRTPIVYEQNDFGLIGSGFSAGFEPGRPRAGETQWRMPGGNWQRVG